MAGRYAKSSGALAPDLPRPETPFRRFKPDFYVPSEKPSRKAPFVPRAPGPGFGRGAGGGGNYLGPARNLGRYARGAARAAGFAGAAYTAWELLDDLYEANWDWQPPGSGWTVKCVAQPRYWGKYIADTKTTTSTSAFVWSQCGLSGQAVAGGDALGQPINIAANVVSLVVWQLGVTGVPRFRIGKVYGRDLPAAAIAGEPMRWAPTVYDGSTLPHMPDPNAERNSPAPAVDPAMDWHGAPPPPPTLPPGTRPSRPGPRTRERKDKGSASVVAKVLKVWDYVSERAETVDALYDALPDRTKKKWGCGKVKRGLIDSAGQYGIDAADCKLQALWHNYHKIDLDKAIKNIVANEIQDKVIGGVAGKLPRNVGHAVDEGQLGINDLLDALFESVGLQ